MGHGCLISLHLTTVVLPICILRVSSESSDGIIYQHTQLCLLHSQLLPAQPFTILTSLWKWPSSERQVLQFKPLCLNKKVRWKMKICISSISVPFHWKTIQLISNNKMEQHFIHIFMYLKILRRVCYLISIAFGARDTGWNKAWQTLPWSSSGQRWELKTCRCHDIQWGCERGSATFPLLMVR